jgi:hypothetical protein
LFFGRSLVRVSVRKGADIGRFQRVALFAAILTAAAAAVASETITYSYDARGRLVKVQRSGSVNNEVTVNYSYDKADNRTNVNVVSPNAPPPGSPTDPPAPPSNMPPTPVSDAGSQGRCTTGTYEVTANDTDPDGDYPLSLVSVSGAGFSILSGTTLQFMSAANSGARVGTYTVQDSRGATASATLTITVSGGSCQ